MRQHLLPKKERLTSLHPVSSALCVPPSGSLCGGGGERAQARELERPRDDRGAAVGDSASGNAAVAEAAAVAGVVGSKSVRVHRKAQVSERSEVPAPCR